MIMVAHKEILHAARLIVEIKGNDKVTPKEIIEVKKCRIFSPRN